MPVLRALAAAALAVLVAVPALVTGRAEAQRTGIDAPVTVMTRNVYLGTDLFGVFSVARPRLGQSDAGRLRRVAHAAHEARSLVDRTSFSTRAGLLADEIGEHEPDLVGLQEVALWLSGPLEPDLAGVPNAQRVDLDFLAILQDALRRRGLHYEVAAAVPEADFEAPSFGPGRTRPRDVRLVLRDVILAKVSPDVEVTDHGRGHFDAQQMMSLPGKDRPFTRGFVWADATVRGQTLRFVNTHLEVGDPRISHAQARQVIEGPAAVVTPVIVVCDCNSDPRRPLRSVAYREFLVQGFVDQWLTFRPAAAGMTCCTASHLRDTGHATMDHRLDFVFARAGRRVSSQDGAVLGATPDSRDPDTGLWPSDHAGVVVTLRSAPEPS